MSRTETSDTEDDVGTSTLASGPAGNYLLPAGFEFQKVVADFERLSAGKELFDRKPLDALKQSADNNERYEILSRFLDTVLPNYDDIDGAQSEIRSAMVDAVQAARSSAPINIETPYGTLEGKSAEKVTRIDHRLGSPSR